MDKYKISLANTFDITTNVFSFLGNGQTVLNIGYLIYSSDANKCTITITLYTKRTVASVDYYDPIPGATGSVVNNAQTYGSFSVLKLNTAANLTLNSPYFLIINAAPQAKIYAPSINNQTTKVTSVYSITKINADNTLNTPISKTGQIYLELDQATIPDQDTIYNIQVIKLENTSLKSIINQLITERDYWYNAYLSLPDCKAQQSQIKIITDSLDPPVAQPKLITDNTTCTSDLITCQVTQQQNAACIDFLNQCKNAITILKSQILGVTTFGNLKIPRIMTQYYGAWREKFIPSSMSFRVPCNFKTVTPCVVYYYETAFRSDIIYVWRWASGVPVLIRQDNLSLSTTDIYTLNFRNGSLWELVDSANRKVWIFNTETGLDRGSGIYYFNGNIYFFG